MSNYKTCTECGANLDHGERYDCADGIPRTEGRSGTHRLTKADYAELKALAVDGVIPLADYLAGMRRILARARAATIAEECLSFKGKTQSVAWVNYDGIRFYNTNADWGEDTLTLGTLPYAPEAQQGVTV